MRIIKPTTYLFSMILALAIANQAFAATEFISVIDTDGSSGDYSTLSSWEQYNQTDLTSATTQVFSGTRTNTIADDATVYLCRGGVYQTHSATVVHTTASQILTELITGAATEQANDIWYTNNTCNSANYFTISDGGDSAISVASCQATTGEADIVAVTISGWTTSDTNYIKVYTTEANRHSGVWDSGKYRLEITLTENEGGDIQFREDYVRIDGLQIRSISDTYSSRLIHVDGPNINATSDIYISNNILRRDNIGHGIIVTDPDAIVKIWNNIIANTRHSECSSGSGIWLDNDATIYAYNNTVYNCQRGIYSGGNSPNIILKNNTCHNSDWDFDNSAWGTGSTNNASSDNSASSASLVNGVTGLTASDEFTNLTLGSEDFHIKSTSNLKDAGTSSVSSINFTDDIDSETRSNHSWDIGADEAAEKIFRSVGPSASSALETGTGNNLTISGSTATFGSDLGNDVGVGDAIQYDTAGAGADPIDAICFIHGRTDETHYTVKNSLGGAPTATIADQDWSIFRAYTSLSLAETGTENTSIDADLVNFDAWSGGKDIVASNEQWNIACYNGEGDAADQTAVTINGWTTGENNYIKVYTPTETTEVGESQRHSGVWDEGKYRLEIGNGRVINLSQTVHIKLTGLQISISPTSTYQYGISASSDSYNFDIEVDSCIFKDTTSTDGCAGINIDRNSSGSNLIVKNSIFYNWIYGALVTGPNGTWTVDFYNNTIYNTGLYGIRNRNASSIFTIKNTAVFNTANDFDGTITIDCCASDDGDGTNAVHWTGGATDWANVFTDYANGDFHLKDFTGTGAIVDQGTDLSSEGFSDDIDGDSRPSPYWDIGADEYPASRKVRFEGDFKMEGDFEIR